MYDMHNKVNARKVNRCTPAVSNETTLAIRQ